METYRELLIGCGRRREKRLALPGEPLEWKNMLAVDNNMLVKPDAYCNLERTPWSFSSPKLDFYDLFRDVVSESLFALNDVFDEVHAYEVLEHLGSQGDAPSFFDVFSEIYRVLKPGGYLFATVPSRYSGWLWGDPSHRRAILPESLVFLDQAQYAAQLDGPNGARTMMSDFRHIYKADFKVIHATDNHQQFVFILKAIKPSRISV